MVLLEFSMSPLGKGESVGQYVARSLEIVDKSGVDYRLNPMGTVLEGDWDDVFGVVKQCYERMRRTATGSRARSRWTTARGPKAGLAEKS